MSKITFLVLSAYYVLVCHYAKVALAYVMINGNFTSVLYTLQKFLDWIGNSITIYYSLNI